MCGGRIRDYCKPLKARLTKLKNKLLPIELHAFKPNKSVGFCVGGFRSGKEQFVNRLTPNDPYMGRTAPLTSKRSILYIYSTNIGTEYFKYALYSPFFSLQNAFFL